MRKFILLAILMIATNAHAVEIDNFKAPLEMITELENDSNLSALTRFYNGYELAYKFNNENFDRYVGIRIVGPEAIVLTDGPSGVSYGYTRNGYLLFANMQFSKLFNNITTIRILPLNSRAFKSIDLIE